MRQLRWVSVGVGGVCRRKNLEFVPSCPVGPSSVGGEEIEMGFRLVTMAFLRRNVTFAPVDLWLVRGEALTIFPPLSVAFFAYNVEFVSMFQGSSGGLVMNGFPSL